MPKFEIAVASADDVQRMAQWAGDEGWNPGNTDAHAFFAADPGGFLVGRLDGEPVTCISVVKYGQGLGFLGFYIARPVGARQRLRPPDLAGRHGADGRPQCRARRRAGPAGELSQVGLPPGLEQHPLRRPAARRQAAGRRQPGRCAERAVRPARRLRPPLLLRGPRQFPGRLDHAARARGHGGPARRQACGFCRHASCRTTSRVGPLFAESPDIAAALVSALAGKTGAKAVAIDVPDINKPASRWSRRPA